MQVGGTIGNYNLVSEAVFNSPNDKFVLPEKVNVKWLHKASSLGRNNLSLNRFIV
jgi:hypothetical protein